MSLSYSESISFALDQFSPKAITSPSAVTVVTRTVPSTEALPIEGAKQAGTSGNARYNEHQLQLPNFLLLP
jgi:hypothetical protein